MQPQVKLPVPTEQEVGRASKPVWTIWRKKKITKHLPAIELPDSLVYHPIAWSLYLTETAKSIKLVYEMKLRTHNIVPIVLSATVMVPKTLHRSWQTSKPERRHFEQDARISIVWHMTHYQLISLQ